MTAIPTVTLNNGVEMPLLGFGVFQINDADECERAVSDALAAGYRLIDTAAAYGNEEAVGRAIRTSGIPRDELFITTKLWISDAGPGRTRDAFERSIERLGLDELDLYLIHQPFSDVHGAWRDMEALHHEGRVRAIGVCNFAPDRIMDIIVHNEITPAVNQIETHPFNQQIETNAFLKENGVQHQSWAPFAEGKNDMFANEVLSGVAARYNRSVAQVILRWLTQRSIVAIPKSVHKERIEENLDIFGFELGDEDMQAIATLDTKTSSFFDHRDPAIVKALGEASRTT